MDNLENFSQIGKLLHLKGDFRGQPDKLSERILEKDAAEDHPGIRVKFIEISDKRDWKEAKVLYKIKRIADSVDYLSFAFEKMSIVLSGLKDIPGVNIDSIGMQEVYCADPYSYYILMYILYEETNKEE